ncbi:Sterol desaturase family protein [Minicystis rosea]|nr:Sterol desaturase family protein [Minicystis rosea]
MEDRYTMTRLEYIAMSIAGGLGMYYGIAGLFELVYYRGRRDQAETWKCQPKRWLSSKMQREQLLLGTANMTAASIASGFFAHYLATGGKSAVYLDWRERGIVFSLVMTVVYFFLTDMGLYWAHRLLHRPLLFRYIHRYHHRYTAPTAFTALATHPLEFATYQSVMLIPLFFMPIYVGGLIAVLLYQNYVALVDHAGVDLHPWIPCRPPTRFHDDHHVHFHVNYGQNLGIWDRIFGTYRRVGRVYGADVFGGRGRAAPGAAEGAPAPYVDYSRKAAPAGARSAPPVTASAQPADTTS